MQNSQLLQADSEHKNVIYLLLTEGGTKILSFLSFVVMARGLTQQSYGVVALAFSVGSLFYIFFNLGLDYHLIRDIRYFLKTNNRAAFQELTSTVATLKVWLLPVFIGIFVIVFLVMQWDRAYFPIMVLIFLYFYIVSTIQLVLFFFRALEKMIYEFITRTIQALIVLLVALLFVYFYKDVLLLSLGYVIASVIIFLGLIIFFIKKLELTPNISRWINKREIALIGKTKYLFLTGVCTSIFSGIDILMISHLRGIEDVAIYKNATMITLALFMIPTAVIQGFYPKLVQHKVELHVFFQMVKKVLIRLIPLGIIIAVVLFAFGSHLIVGIFGETYAASLPLFRVSLLAFLFAVVNQVFGYGMIAIGEYKTYFFITFIVSIVSALLNIVLISTVGLMGGIFALNISHLLLIVLPVIYLYFLHTHNIEKETVV